MQSCTLTRDLGVPRLARTRFASTFGESAAPFGLAPASQSVGETVERLREQEELDLGPYELSPVLIFQPAAPIRPSAQTTRRIEQAMVGAAAAIMLLTAGGTPGWLL